MKVGRVQNDRVLACCNENTNPTSLVTTSGHSSQTEGKSLVQKAERLRENLSGDKSLQAHAGTHLLYWM